jgi:hypothetical protein
MTVSIALKMASRTCMDGYSFYCTAMPAMYRSSRGQSKQSVVEGSGKAIRHTRVLRLKYSNRWGSAVKYLNRWGSRTGGALLFDSKTRGPARINSQIKGTQLNKIKFLTRVEAMCGKLSHQRLMQEALSVS